MTVTATASREEDLVRGHLAHIQRGPGGGAAEPRGPGGPGEGSPGAGSAGLPCRVRGRASRGIRWGCCWSRQRAGCRSWCRSGTGGCWCPRSPSTGGGRRCRWRRIWLQLPPRGFRCSCAGMRTCPISGRSPRRSGAWSSTSTTSTRLCPARSSGTSSGWRPAWPWRAGTTGSPPRSAARSSWRRPRATAPRCAPSPGSRCWTSGTPTWTSSRPSASSAAQVKTGRFKAAQGLLAKAHTRDSTQALGKLTTMAGGRRRIISDPPMIVPVEEVFAEVAADAIYAQLRTVLGKYRRTLQSDRRRLLEQFTLVQVARKVVGVGSVGTRAWVLLMDAAGRGGAVVPAGQGGPAVGSGGVLRAQPVRQPGRARRRRAAPDASPQRHLPRLDPRPRPRRGGPRLLRPPAAGLEILRADRGR